MWKEVEEISERTILIRLIMKQIISSEDRNLKLYYVKARIEYCSRCCANYSVRRDYFLNFVDGLHPLVNELAL